MAKNFFYHLDILDPQQLLISEIIKQRNIRWLCHFTPRKNLKEIKRIGLKPRNLLDHTAIFTDSFRYDQNKNAICLSISKPNKWMFDMKRKQGFDLCLLLIDPAILYKKNCLFYPHNAATASYRSMERTLFSTEQALENLFSDVITYQKSGREPQDIHRSWNMELENCETTSDQAEVQCLDIIEPEYIKCIIEDQNIPLSYQEILEYLSSIESVLLDGNIELKDIYNNEELLENSFEQRKNLLITDPPKPIKVKSLLTTNTNSISDGIGSTIQTARADKLVKFKEGLSQEVEKELIKTDNSLKANRSNYSKLGYLGETSRNDSLKTNHSESSYSSGDSFEGICVIILIIIICIILF